MGSGAFPGPGCRHRQGPAQDPTPGAGPGASGPLGVVAARRGEVTIVRFAGEVNRGARPVFSAALAVATAACGPALELDLRAAAFTDDAAAAGLVHTTRRATRAGVRLRVVPPAVAPAGFAAHLGGPAVLVDAPGPADAGGGLRVALDSPRDGVLVLRPSGAAHGGSADLLADLVPAAATVATEAVVVDLARLGALDDVVARVLVAAAGDAAGGTAVHLACGSPRIRRALRTHRGAADGRWFGSVADAVAAGRGEGGGRGRLDEYEHLMPLFAELRRFGPGDPRRWALREELIRGYLPVARRIARKHLYRGEILDDLEQVATLGLINAVDRFDPDRGVDFLSYAIPTVNGEVQRHYRDRTSTIRVPRPLQEVQFRVVQAADEMSQSMGRAPTPSEVAARLDLDLNTVVESLQAAYETRPSSLDEPRSGDDDSPSDARFGRALGRADPDLAMVEMRQSLAPLLDRLPVRERDILLLRFYGNMTQTEIAKRTGISQMHVSRLLAATLAKLRTQLDSGS